MRYLIIFAFVLPAAALHAFLVSFDNSWANAFAFGSTMIAGQVMSYALVEYGRNKR